MPTPEIIDLSHWNTVRSFTDVRAAGIVGVIHKATEGYSYVDENYTERKTAAINAGLAWSSYHFLKHGNASAQMDWYLKNVMPVTGARVCIDFEDPACTLDDLEDAVAYLFNAGLNLQVTVYSGNLIKEYVGEAHNDLLEGTSLWLAQYTSGTPTWPKNTWPHYTLWQYTDNGRIDGIDGAVDLNNFNGTKANCVKWMLPVGDQPAPTPEPEPHENTITVIAPPGVHVRVVQSDGEV